MKTNKTDLGTEAALTTSQEPGVIVRRSQVPLSQTWDLSSFYRDFAHWDEVFAGLPDVCEVEAAVLERYRGHLGEGASKIAEVIEFWQASLRGVSRLFVYAKLRLSEDLTAGEAGGRMAKAEIYSSEIVAAFAFVEPELLALESLPIWLSDPALAAHRFYLEKLLKGKAHVLTDKEEALLALLSPCLEKFEGIYAKWLDADSTFLSVQDAAGTEQTVSHGRYSLLMTSKDRVLRENAFRSIFGECTSMRQTIAENYLAYLQTGSTLARIRQYPSFIEMSLSEDCMPLAVYDSLIAKTRASLAASHQGTAFRAKALGLAKMSMWDRLVPLSAGNAASFSWEEACQLILASLAPLGADYVEVARRGLGEDRWVDYAENTGKDSGAFSWGFYDASPIIQLTWNGTMDALFTLAHEVGHSLHTHYSNKAQPYHLANYSLFVAEVASTLNEALLADYLLATRADLAAEVLSYKIANFEGTFLRQVMFAAFERDISQKVDRGEEVTADVLDVVHAGLVREWFGESLAMSEGADFEGAGWMVIPHFYCGFYVYQYATSYCASQALAAALKAEPETARARILTMLAAGGSDYPLSIMKAAGIDYQGDELYHAAFGVYLEDLELGKKLFIDL